MALTASEILRLARLEHPALTESVVPNPLALRLLDRAQRDLSLVAHQQNPWFLSKPWWVHIRREDSTVLAGAGTLDGWPVKSRQATVERSDLPSDSLAELSATATVRVAETASTSASDTSLTKSGAGWSVNAWANKIVVVKKGHAEGQKRVVISNTSDTLTFAALDPPAVAGDIFTVVDSTWTPSVTQAVMQGQLPPTQTSPAYYVTVDANGVATVDVTVPLVAQVDVGAPVPPNYGVLASWVYHRDLNGIVTRSPGYIGDASHAAFPHLPYTTYMVGQRLHLAGSPDLWRDVNRIELRYCPIPPAVRTLSDTLLLPDELQDVLALELAANMGVQAGLRKQDVDVTYFGALRDSGRSTLMALVQNNFATVHQRIVEAF